MRGELLTICVANSPYGDRYDDKFGLYVYVSDEDKMIPFDAWMRRMKPGERYFMGGVMDYHW